MLPGCATDRPLRERTLDDGVISLPRAIAFSTAARNTCGPVSALPRFHLRRSMPATAATPLATDAPWVVLKFGGTSVATAERWRTILDLAAARRAAGMRVLVVVSALSGITDALKALCRCAPSEREDAWASVVARHRELAVQMQLADVARVEHWLASLRALVFPLPPGERVRLRPTGSAVNGISRTEGRAP